jgi:hypothetical protein
MGARALSDEQIKAVITGYLANDRNYTHTAANTGHRLRRGLQVRAALAGWPARARRPGCRPTPKPAAPVLRAATDADTDETATVTTHRRQGCRHQAGARSAPHRSASSCGTRKSSPGWCAVHRHSALADKSPTPW